MSTLWADFEYTRNSAKVERKQQLSFYFHRKTNRKPKMKNGKAFASPTPIVEVSDEQKKKLYKNPMIEGVRWIERYADTLEKAWSKVPKYFANVLVTLSIFVIGSALKGKDLKLNDK